MIGYWLLAVSSIPSFISIRKKESECSLSVIIKGCGVDSFQKTICKRLKQALKNEQSYKKWANARTKMREGLFMSFSTEGSPSICYLIKPGHIFISLTLLSPWGSN